MNYELTLEAGRLAYPELHPTREHMIEFLFCVLGNGFEWRDGELVERCEDERYKVVIRMLKNSSPHDEIAKVVKKMQRRNAPVLPPKLRQLLGTMRLDLSSEPPVPALQRVYPLCNLSHLTNLPKDIRKDWLGGAAEAAKIVRRIGGHENAKWLPKIEKDIKRLRMTRAGGK